jgi:hypothetical protein
MMNRRTTLLLLVCLALVAAGCRGPQLVSRPLTDTETDWAGAIQRSYPSWKPPFFMPDRAHWTPRPISDADLLPMLEGEASPAVVPSPEILPAPAPVEVAAPPAATAPPAAVTAKPGETVVDVAVPAAPSSMVPPKQPAASPSPGVSAEPKVAPAKVVSEPGLDDVEFVPADAPK